MSVPVHRTLLFVRLNMPMNQHTSTTPLQIFSWGLPNAGRCVVAWPFQLTGPAGFQASMASSCKGLPFCAVTIRSASHNMLSALTSS